MAECQTLPVSILSFKRKLSWAGHLARLPHDRLVYKTWLWRNSAWRRRRQTWIFLGARDFRHTGQIGFPRRWETSVEKFQNWCRDLHHDHRNWNGTYCFRSCLVVASHVNTWTSLKFMMKCLLSSCSVLLQSVCCLLTSSCLSLFCFFFFSLSVCKQ